MQSFFPLHSLQNYRCLNILEGHFRFHKLKNRIELRLLLLLGGTTVISFLLLLLLYFNCRSDVKTNLRDAGLAIGNSQLSNIRSLLIMRLASKSREARFVTFGKAPNAEINARAHAG